MYKDFSDTEELSRALAHANVSAVQVNKGTFEASLCNFAMRGWNLQLIDFRRGESACAGDGPRDRNAIVVPLRIAPNSRLLGSAVDSCTLAFYAPGSEHADRTAGQHAAAVIVPPASLETMAAAEGISLARHGSHIVTATADCIWQLRCLLSEIELTLRYDRELLQGPEVDKSLGDSLMRALIQALRPEHATGSQFGRPRLSRAAVLRKVLAILDERRGEPIYAGELATEVDVSQATLQRIFVDLFGMPPARYLLLKRYYLARRRLREGRMSSVTEVASSLGFWELSRFSSNYRSLFGELPSETIRAGRRPKPH